MQKPPGIRRTVYFDGKGILILFFRSSLPPRLGAGVDVKLIWRENHFRCLAKSSFTEKQHDPGETQNKPLFQP